MLEHRERGILQQVICIGVALDERACERTQAVELAEQGIRCHLYSMPPPAKVLANAVVVAADWPPIGCRLASGSAAGSAASSAASSTDDGFDCKAVRRIRGHHTPRLRTIALTAVAGALAARELADLPGDIAVGDMRCTGTTLALASVVLDFQWQALTELWCRAIDVHDRRPLTWPAAIAADAVGREDCRRRGLGIPSIFELPAPSVELASPRQRRGSP